MSVIGGLLRNERLAGRFARVDDIPFELPISSRDSPALFAAFGVDADAAAALLPTSEVQPIRLAGRSVMLVTVIDYRDTTIGTYVEFSIAIVCRRGLSVGQFVLDLPVSTEISVKGGQGIWGMPKHRASLDFLIDDELSTVSSQYDLDGELCMRVTIERPGWSMPLRATARNYCRWRGMLFASRVRFEGRLHAAIAPGAMAKIELGPHPRVEPLHGLDIDPAPLFCGYIPSSSGVLDDAVQSWMISEAQPPGPEPGLEAVVGLGLGQDWPAPPDRNAVATGP